MFDFGDAPVDPLSTERSMREIRKYVSYEKVKAASDDTVVVAGLRLRVVF